MCKISSWAIAVSALLACTPAFAADPAIACKDQVDLISITGLTNEDNASLADLTVAQEAASTALVQNDAKTAMSQLEGLQAKVMELSSGATPKISAQDAKTLLHDVGVAMACVRAL